MTEYNERENKYQNQTQTVEKRKIMKRLNADIGVQDGKATIWIKKSLKECSIFCTYEKKVHEASF